ncbi:killer cell lectin-like receptor subfamily B member 1 [Branchiostoma lanceolatum]|uniref:killer cell lectin-like receptor subfamily B member 1 n=1 Tax=Branchiostoma lanceolatum TaxID=7740 RepID=UPI003453251A
MTTTSSLSHVSSTLQVVTTTLSEMATPEPEATSSSDVMALPQVSLPVTNVTQRGTILTTEKKNTSTTSKANNASCPAGYKLIARTCIRLSLQRKSFYHAKRSCSMEGATLAMPKTAELDVTLGKLVSIEGDKLNHWIGMKDEGRFNLKKRNWRWMDGSALGNYKVV